MPIVMREASSETNRRIMMMLSEIVSAGRLEELRQSCDHNRRRGIDSLISLQAAGEERRKRIIEPTRRAVIDFYRTHFTEFETYHTLLSRLAKLEHFDQKSISKFVGRYSLFLYSTRSERKYTSQTLEITEQDDMYKWHSIVKTDSDVFRHFGYVFDYGNRLYLTGMGPTFTRPILIAKPSTFEPKNDRLRGILMSITDRKELYSSNFVAFHDKFKERNLLDNDEFIQYSLREDSPVGNAIRISV